MKNLKLGMQLAMGFLLLMMLITGIGIWRLRAAGDATNFMVREAMHLQEQQLSAAVTEKREAYIGARNAVFQARENGNFAEARRLIDTSMKPALDAYVLSVNNVLDYQRQIIDQSAQEIESNFRYGSLLLMVISAATIILGFATASCISCRLGRQLGGEPQCAGVSPQIDNGNMDLSTRTEQAAG